MKRKQPAIERAARALCTARGLPENTKFEGRPMWESFIPEARAVLDAVGVDPEQTDWPYQPSLFSATPAVVTAPI